MNSRVVALVPFLACAAFYAAVVRGHFLSDDMAVIYVLSGWQEHGELWTRLMSKFTSGLDAPSNYYRPLTFFSFGLNLSLPGIDPAAWHLVNLGGHLVAGIAVYRITALLRPGTSTRAGPAFAAALFLLCGTNAEAVAWISGRYDVFATAFSLWAAVHYLQSNSGHDRRALAALLCGACALASKESGAVLPALIGCLAWAKHSGLPGHARFASAARDCVPWLVLIAAYFALRFAIFGSMLQVYPGTQPLARIADGGLWTTAHAVLPWLSAALPSRTALLIATVTAALLASVHAIALARVPQLRNASLAVAVAAALSLALLLPHLSGLSADGEGGRLFYTTSALLAIWFALPIGLGESNQMSTTMKRGVGAAALVLAISHAVLLDAALRDWRTAGEQMSRMVAALPALERSIKTDGYGLVIAPDAIGAAPYARNAQGGILLPPIQPQPLLPRMIVFLPQDVGQIPELLKQQLIPTLKQHSLDEAAVKMQLAIPAASPETTIWFSDVFCWREDKGALQRVEVAPNPQDDRRWVADVHDGLRRAGCRKPSRLVTAK